MDSFTENLLSRARERQKMIQGYGQTHVNAPNVTLSEPNLSQQSPTKGSDNYHKNNSEGNISKFTRQNSTTRVSSEIISSPNSQKHKTLNIQNDNFNMEIKVSSADNVRVEVQIEEHHEDSDSDENGVNDGGLRPDAKNRLNRLGQLYAGGEDADISSPIHRTEGNFHTTSDSPKAAKAQNNKGCRGLKKLADLAQTINQYEDDLSSIQKEKSEKSASTKKSWKAPAPKPPSENTKKRSPVKVKPKAPSPPKSSEVKWDKKVLDSLESQGFTRTDSSTRLIYKYDTTNQESKVADIAKVERRSDKENKIEEEIEMKPKSPIKIRSMQIADKAAIFESNPNKTKQEKDPALMSVSERKALFERNKGTALVPKAPFGMSVPAKSVHIDNKNEKVVVKAKGIAHQVASLFDSKSTISQTQIESNIREQRQKDMEMLLNRFHKVEQTSVAPRKEIEEHSDDDDDATEETAMIPEKSVKILPTTETNENKRNSGNKRFSKSDSPKVAAVLSEVKRIKVSPKKAGRLYPSLTDIESVTETENESGDTRSPTPNNSSFERSIAESDDANTSFGRDILQAVCKNQTPQKRQIFDDSGSTDLSDVLDDMDDYIDEALAFNNGGPSPPKQGRQSPIESSNSFNYKSFQSPKVEHSLPTHVVEGDNLLPLTHTVSFYRKQQASTTPVRQISRQPVIDENAEVVSAEMEEIQTKMMELKHEVSKQEMIISQTSQALNLCNSTPEFMGSTEQVEAERVLLVATHRRQAALHELQRVEVENSLRPHRHNSSNLPLQKGTLTISKIVLPLKQKYVTALAAAGGKGHHVVCLIKYADQVVPTQLVSTVATNAKNPELELAIPGVLKLNNVYSDFTITFEVYCLQAQEEVLPHEIKYHIKKTNNKLTPKKTKNDSRLMRPIKESPAGPQAVRSPTFALMGYTVVSIQSCNKKHWSLNNAPSMSPLEGTVEMCITCELALTVEHRGFLTMFEDVSGFGAWHRRWCLLKGHVLCYWKYPDDEKRTAPIDSINLKNAITKQVGPVSRDICARLHTFLIETERAKHPQDKDTLVMVCQGDKTIIRHLLSADTKEERIEWCNKFNAALAALNVWGNKKE